MFDSKSISDALLEEVRDHLDKLLEPKSASVAAILLGFADALDKSYLMQVSLAISAKRIADVLDGRQGSGTPGQPGFDGGQLGLADAIGNAIYNAIANAAATR